MGQTEPPQLLPDPTAEPQPQLQDPTAPPQQGMLSEDPGTGQVGILRPAIPPTPLIDDFGQPTFELPETPEETEQLLRGWREQFTAYANELDRMFAAQLQGQMALQQSPEDMQQERTENTQTMSELLRLQMGYTPTQWFGSPGAPDAPDRGREMSDAVSELEAYDQGQNPDHIRELRDEVGRQRTVGDALMQDFGTMRKEAMGPIAEGMRKDRGAIASAATKTLLNTLSGGYATEAGSRQDQAVAEMVRLTDHLAEQRYSGRGSELAEMVRYVNSIPGLTEGERKGALRQGIPGEEGLGARLTGSTPRMFPDATDEMIDIAVDPMWHTPEGKKRLEQIEAAPDGVADLSQEQYQQLLLYEVFRKDGGLANSVGDPEKLDEYFTVGADVFADVAMLMPIARFLGQGAKLAATGLAKGAAAAAKGGAAAAGSQLVMRQAAGMARAVFPKAAVLTANATKAAGTGLGAVGNIASKAFSSVSNMAATTATLFGAGWAYKQGDITEGRLALVPEEDREKIENAMRFETALNFAMLGPMAYLAGIAGRTAAQGSSIGLGTLMRPAKSTAGAATQRNVLVAGEAMSAGVASSVGFAAGQEIAQGLIGDVFNDLTGEQAEAIETAAKYGFIAPGNWQTPMLKALEALSKGDLSAASEHATKFGEAAGMMTPAFMAQSMMGRAMREGLVRRRSGGNRQWAMFDAMYGDIASGIDALDIPGPMKDAMKLHLDDNHEALQGEPHGKEEPARFAVKKDPELNRQMEEEMAVRRIRGEAEGPVRTLKEERMAVEQDLVSGYGGREGIAKEGERVPESRMEQLREQREQLDLEMLARDEEMSSEAQQEAARMAEPTKVRLTKTAWEHLAQTSPESLKDVEAKAVGSRGYTIDATPEQLQALQKEVDFRLWELEGDTPNAGRAKSMRVAKEVIEKALKLSAPDFDAQNDIAERMFKNATPSARASAVSDSRVIQQIGDSFNLARAGSRDRSRMAKRFATTAMQSRLPAGTRVSMGDVAYTVVDVTPKQITLRGEDSQVDTVWSPAEFLQRAGEEGFQSYGKEKASPVERLQAIVQRRYGTTKSRTELGLIVEPDGKTTPVKGPRDAGRVDLPIPPGLDYADVVTIHTHERPAEPGESKGFSTTDLTEFEEAGATSSHFVVDPSGIYETSVDPVTGERAETKEVTAEEVTERLWGEFYKPREPLGEKNRPAGLPARPGGVFAPNHADPARSKALATAEGVIEQIVSGQKGEANPASVAYEAEVARLKASGEYSKAEARDEALRNVVRARSGFQADGTDTPLTSTKFRDQIKELHQMLTETVMPLISAQRSMDALDRFALTMEPFFTGPESTAMQAVPAGRKLMERIRNLERESFWARGELSLWRPFSWANSGYHFGRRFLRGALQMKFGDFLVSEAMREPVIGASRMSDWFRWTQDLTGPTSWAGFIGRDAGMLTEIGRSDLTRLHSQILDSKVGIFTGIKANDTRDTAIFHALDQGPESKEWKALSEEDAKIATNIRDFMEDLRKTIVRLHPRARGLRREIDFNRRLIDSIEDEIKVNEERLREAEAEFDAAGGNDLRETLRVEEGRETPNEDIVNQAKADLDEAGAKRIKGLQWQIKRDKGAVDRVRARRDEYREELQEFIDDWGFGGRYIRHLAITPTEQGSLSMFEQMERSGLFKDPKKGQTGVQERFHVVRQKGASFTAKREGRLAGADNLQTSAMTAVWSYVRDATRYIRVNELLSSHDEFFHGKLEPVAKRDAYLGNEHVYYMNGQYRMAGSGNVVRGPDGAPVGFQFERQLSPYDQKMWQGEQGEHPEGSTVDSDTSVLLYRGDGLGRTGQEGWWKAHENNIEFVPKEMARERIRIQRDGWFGRAQAMKADWSADRMRDYINKQFVGHLQEIATGNLGENFSHIRKVTEKFAGALTGWVSALTIGGTINLDNAGNAGFGGLMLGYLAIGRTPSMQAGKAWSRAMLSQKKLQKHVDGALRASRGRPESGVWADLNAKAWEKMAASQEELDAMTPEKRRSRKIEDEATKWLMRSVLTGGNRGDQMSNMLHDVRDMFKDTPDPNRINRGDGVTAVMKTLSNIHWAPFNVAESAARGIPFIQMYIEAREGGAPERVAAARAWSTVHAIQMMFSRVTKSPFMNTPIGRMMTSLGTWRLHWAGRYWKARSPEGLGAQMKMTAGLYAALHVAMEAGFDFTDLLGSRLGDWGILGDAAYNYAFNIGEETEEDPAGVEPSGFLHDRGMATYMMPAVTPKFWEGPIIDAAKTGTEGFMKYLVGDEVEGKALMFRALRTFWQPNMYRDWVRAAPDSHDPVTGRLLRKNEPGNTRWDNWWHNVFYGRNRYRTWDIAEQTRRSARRVRAMTSMKTDTGSLIGKGLFKISQLDDQVADGELTAARAQSQREVLSARFREQLRTYVTLHRKLRASSKTLDSKSEFVRMLGTQVRKAWLDSELTAETRGIAGSRGMRLQLLSGELEQGVIKDRAQMRAAAEHLFGGGASTKYAMEGIMETLSKGGTPDWSQPIEEWGNHGMRLLQKIVRESLESGRKTEIDNARRFARAYRSAATKWPKKR